MKKERLGLKREKKRLIPKNKMRLSYCKMGMKLLEKIKTEKGKRRAWVQKRREKQEVGLNKMSSPKPDTQTSSVLTGLLSGFVNMALVTTIYSRFLGTLKQFWDASSVAQGDHRIPAPGNRNETLYNGCLYVKKQEIAGRHSAKGHCPLCSSSK